MLCLSRSGHGPRQREPGARIQHPPRHQGHGEIAFRARAAAQEVLHPHAPHGAEDGVHIPVRQARQQIKVSIERNPRTPKNRIQGLALLLGPMGEVGQRPDMNLAPLPIGFAQQNRGVRVSVRDRGDKHDHTIGKDKPMSIRINHAVT